MTDSREIIAQYLCDRAGQGWSAISPFERAAYRTAAHGMIATLAAAGYRILGPDEVDQVTLEKCAEAMELARAVLAQSITAGHNVPGPTPEDIEKAFWALDAALTAKD